MFLLFWGLFWLIVIYAVVAAGLAWIIMLIIFKATGHKIGEEEQYLNK